MKQLVSLLFILSSLVSLAQKGTIKGRVYDDISNDPIPFANVVVEGSQQGGTTDSAGNYQITGLEPGLYNLKVSYVGYKTEKVYEVQVTQAKPAVVNIAMEENVEALDEVEVKASPFSKTSESPVSLRTIGSNEIQRSPGSNRDISRVIQSFAGVSSTAAFRNDIIIRGGSPSENSFYLDGIEVPNINHFATQGASGGPTGMINVDFIKSVDFHAGAFPANRGGALSSIMEFDQKRGRQDRIGGTATIGASEVGLTLEGPIGDRITFMLSARRSYLQFLFQVIELPFLPTYNDFQLRSQIDLGEDDELVLMGLGAIDNLELNTKENDTEVQKYILGNIPENDQWSYTVGARYKHFWENSYFTLVASRNHLKNLVTKYEDNDENNPDKLLFDYESDEIENKLRAEHTIRKKGYKFNYGLKYEYATYTNSTFNKIITDNGIFESTYNTELNINQGAAFGQVSRPFLENRLTLSLGIRSDVNDYSDDMSNPLKQLSPRFSLSYSILPDFNFNANVGIYYQLPPYTSMGFQNNQGQFVNKQNDLTYINNKQVVAGFDYNTSFNTQFSIEGFWKQYDNYPFLLNDSISLANQGGDFGVIGAEPVNSSSEGRAYGVEFMAQQKLYKGFYGILAYTYVRSEFTDGTGKYQPSSWDNKHLVSITAGKKFNKNWEIGVKWRLRGGEPYTPYDVEKSSLVQNWQVKGEGIPDYDRLNEKRAEVFHQLDLRVDKKFFFDEWSLNLYLDIENVYINETAGQPYLTVQRDENGDPIIDPDSNPQNPRYKMKRLENVNGNILPSIGVVVDI